MASLEGGHDDDAQPDLFTWLWRISWREQLWLLTLAVLAFPLSMAPLELQRRMINHAIDHAGVDLLLYYGALYLGVVLLQGGLKYVLQVRRERLGERTVQRMRRRIVEKRVEQVRDGDDSDGPAEGQIIPMIANEVERVGGFVGVSLSEPLLQGGVLAVILGYMLFVEPQIALISLAFFLPQVVVVPILQRRMNRHAGRKVGLVRELGERVGDRELCVEHGDEHERYIERIFDSRIAYVRVKYLLKFLTNLFNHLAPLSVLVIGGWFAIQGRTDVGTVAAFITGFERMSDPARQLLAHYRLTSETRVKYALLAQHFRL